MRKVSTRTKTSFRKKGSKFLGYLFPTESIQAFDHELSKLQSKYPDATHHCYAWRINPVNIKEFAQDYGEPGGSAGLPILNQLKSYKVVNAGIVVVRYYGGTNLGKSGLIKAYGEAAELCLQQAKLSPVQLIQKVEITYPYDEQNALEQLRHQYDLNQLDASYTDRVKIIIACPMAHQTALKEHLTQLKHRGIKAEFLGTSYL